MRSPVMGVRAKYQRGWNGRLDLWVYSTTSLMYSLRGRVGSFRVESIKGAGLMKPTLTLLALILASASGAYPQQIKITNHNYVAATGKWKSDSAMAKPADGSTKVAIIAEPGMGKTTLLYQLAQELRDTTRIVHVSQTQCNSQNCGFGCCTVERSWRSRHRR